MIRILVSDENLVNHLKNNNLKIQSKVFYGHLLKIKNIISNDIKIIKYNQKRDLTPLIDQICSDGKKGLGYPGRVSQRKKYQHDHLSWFYSGKNKNISLVAYDGKELMRFACLGFIPNTKESWVQDLYVSSKYRNNGVSKAFMNNICKMADKKKLKYVFGGTSNTIIMKVLNKNKIRDYAYRFTY